MPKLTDRQIDQFVDRCHLCAHKSWDAGDSGLPLYSTCKQVAHAPIGATWGHPDCARVAEHYDGNACPKFWPVILRAPVRLVMRGLARWIRKS